MLLARTQAEAEAQVRRMLGLQLALERAALPRAASAMRALLRAVADTVESGAGVDGLVVDRHVRLMVGGLHAEAVRLVAQDHAGLTERAADHRQLTQEWLRREGAARVQRISEALRRDIAAVVARLEAEGLGVDEIARRLRRQVDLPPIGRLDPEVRARFIARTEVHAAAQWARYVFIEETFPRSVLEEAWKSWGAVLDFRVRDTHAVANGQRVRWHEHFQVGAARLRFPGDPDVEGHPEEIVNCRCQFAFHLDTAAIVRGVVVEPSPRRRAPKKQPVTQPPAVRPMPLPRGTGDPLLQDREGVLRLIREALAEVGWSMEHDEAWSIYERLDITSERLHALLLYARALRDLMVAYPQVRAALTSAGVPPNLLPWVFYDEGALARASVLNDVSLRVLAERTGGKPLRTTGIGEPLVRWLGSVAKLRSLATQTSGWTTSSRLLTDARLGEPRRKLVAWRAAAATVARVTAAHEVGHLLEGALNFRLEVSPAALREFAIVSRYGATSPQETWAELCAIWSMPHYRAHWRKWLQVWQRKYRVRVHLPDERGRVKTVEPLRLLDRLWEQAPEAELVGWADPHAPGMTWELLERAIRETGEGGAEP